MRRRWDWPPGAVPLDAHRSATYVYVANSHNGSIAVTAAVTGDPDCGVADDLGAALRQAEHGVAAQRTFRFRHTGNLKAKFAEARRVLGMGIDHEKQFKVLVDASRSASGRSSSACCAICG